MIRRVLFTALMLASAMAAAPQDDGLPRTDFREGSPADHLPKHIRRLTGFGERPQFSLDGKKILFLGTVLGEVHEYDLASGFIRSVSGHFRHYGFTRAVYLQ